MHNAKIFHEVVVSVTLPLKSSFVATLWYHLLETGYTQKSLLEITVEKCTFYVILWSMDLGTTWTWLGL